MKIHTKYILILGCIAILLIGVISYHIVTPFYVNDKEESTPVADSQNPYVHLSYYHEDFLGRYTSYHSEYPEYSVEDIVTHVNMGIDSPFYTRDPITVTNPNDIDVLINKIYKLPDEWEPDDLIIVDDYGHRMREVAAIAFQQFAAACKEEGFSIYVYSGYRSTEHQQQIYDNMILYYGEEYTNNYISRPGQSEHSTGLTADVSIDGIYYEDIESSPYYSWFYDHLAEYGFILRYPQGKQHLTGYHHESWHIRYLGVEEAQKVKASGLTYDEYIARR